MKQLSRLLFSLLLPVCVQAQNYQKLHSKALVVDTHNDVLTQALEKNVVFDEDMKAYAHSDLRRMKQGGIDVQVFSVWCDASYGAGKAFARANREIDTLYEWVKRNPSEMMIIKTPRDLEQAVKTKKLACMMGVEGGHMIENNLQYLDSLYKRGVRYMTLTWNNSTPWATSAMEETSGKFTNAKKGLNAFGIQVVNRMNQLGMMVDLAHVGEQTFWDAIHTTSKPVIVSHSCVHAICPVFRNLKDDQIDAVGENGGVIHLNFFSGFLDSNFQRKFNAFNEKHKEERDTILKMNPEPFFADSYLAEKYADEVKDLRPPLSLLIDHIDYIVKRIGVEHVGLGSDFDGITSAPLGLDDVSCFPLITKALMERGYSNGAIKKILGANFLRVFKANTAYR